MLRLNFLYLFLLFVVTVTSAQNEKLEAQLWSKVKLCSSAITEDTENGTVAYEELIDDAKNGYLKISGSFPTCGCNCNHTIGAYKDAFGAYVFLEKEQWGCDWSHSIKSNKKLEQLFPKNLKALFFSSQLKEKATANAYFYIDIEIPQIGTDTEVSIKVIPLGLSSESVGHATFNYSQEDSPTRTSYYEIIQVVHRSKNEHTLNAILNGDFEAIGATDKTIMEQLMKSNSDIDSFAHFQTQALELKKIYDEYLQIKHPTIVLRWNRQKATFEVKEKGIAPAKLSFKEFLLNTLKWGYVC